MRPTKKAAARILLWLFIRGICGDAFVCAGWACVRAAAREISDYEMAWVGGNVAEDDRDDFGV